MFFQNWTIQIQTFLFLVEVFCKHKSSYHFSPMFRLRSTNNVLDIDEKTTPVERIALQIYLLCLQITKLFIMTQGPSKFSAHMSDAGPQKSVSPANTTGLHV